MRNNDMNRTDAIDSEEKANHFIQQMLYLFYETYLLNLFIKCESPKLDVIAEFVSLKL